MYKYEKLEIGGREFYLFTDMEYEKNEDNSYEVQSLSYYGAIALLNDFLNTWLCYEETIQETMSNTSELRDGNRIDIHDNYSFSEILGLDTNGDEWEIWEISNIWITKSGLAYIEIYNTTQECKVGFIELPNM